MPAMYRRSVLVSAVTAAAVMLAVAGCKPQVPSAAQASAASPEQTAASGAGQARTSGVTRAGALIIEPGGGFSPVYHLIMVARHSIDVTMYEFADRTAEHDLAAAARRGVRVRVVLDQREQSENSAAYSYFRSHGVTV